MKLAISSLTTLILLTLIRAEIVAGGGGGGGTTAGSMTEAAPSTSPMVADTSGSGINGRYD